MAGNATRSEIFPIWKTPKTKNNLSKQREKRDRKKCRILCAVLHTRLEFISIDKKIPRHYRGIIIKKGDFEEILPLF